MSGHLDLGYDLQDLFVASIHCSRDETGLTHFRIVGTGKDHSASVRGKGDIRIDVSDKFLRSPSQNGYAIEIEGVMERGLYFTKIDIVGVGGKDEALIFGCRRWHDLRVAAGGDIV